MLVASFSHCRAAICRAAERTVDAESAVLNGIGSSEEFVRILWHLLGNGLKLDKVVLSLCCDRGCLKYGVYHVRLI